MSHENVLACNFCQRCKLSSKFFQEYLNIGTQYINFSPYNNCILYVLLQQTILTLTDGIMSQGMYYE